MQKVLTEQIWDSVAEKANGRRKCVAVAFVTDLGKLKLTRGDELICDASDGNIIAGVVDRDLLKKLYRKGVDVYSYQGLHAKCAVFGKYSLVGSSNLSINSASELEEVALLTDDKIVQSKILARMSEWKENGQQLDSVGLKRMMKLPRVKRHWKVGRRKQKTGRDENRFWVIGVEEAEFTQDEQRVFDQDRQLAEGRKRKYHVKDHSQINELCWLRDCGFMNDSVVGDFVIEITGKEVSPIQVVLSKRLKGKVGFFHLAPVNGLRKRTLADFNKALDIPRKKRVYNDKCSRLLKKEYVKRLLRLWNGIEVGE